MKRSWNFWKIPFRRGAAAAPAAPAPPPQPAATPAEPLQDIAPSDALLLYFQHNPGAVDVEKLQLDSPALNRLKAHGMKLVVPLMSQGELIGLLNLGPRLSEQDYSSDDRALLNTLATQASPAV